MYKQMLYDGGDKGHVMDGYFMNLTIVKKKGMVIF